MSPSTLILNCGSVCAQVRSIQDVPCCTRAHTPRRTSPPQVKCVYYLGRVSRVMLQTHLQHHHFDIQDVFLHRCISSQHLILKICPWMPYPLESHIGRTEGRQLTNSVQLMVFLWLTPLMLKWVTQSRRAKPSAFSQLCGPRSTYLIHL